MPTEHSVTDLITLLAQKKVSSVELTQAYLDKIQNLSPPSTPDIMDPADKPRGVENKPRGVEGRQPSSLNAFIHVNPEASLAEAKHADSLRQKHLHSVLTGIPLAHKDIFCTTEMPTTCGSKMLENYISPFDATIVSKLKQHGMVTLGKTNMDEFAMGSSNENSYFGPALNPWDTTKVPGGSSGGSAIAIAAGLAPIATGSDTGGSVRQPAAFCNISGLKPTYGLISRFGMVAYASSLDQAGIMGQSVEDISYLLEAMAGFDPKDSTSAEKPIPAYSAELKNNPNSLKIGLPRCYFNPAVAPAIQQAIQEAIKVYEGLGAEIIELDFTLLDLWVPCYYVIACAEASSNLARFDGLRYGHRSQNMSSLEALITSSRSEGFGLEVKRRILTGTHVLSAGYFDAYYLQALKIRRLIQQEFIQAFKKVDIILGPTTPTTAFTLGEKTIDPILNYLADIFTVPVNLIGFPAISIPAGFDGPMPIGMQLIGSAFNETTLLNTAHRYQQVTDSHRKKPGQLS